MIFKPLKLIIVRFMLQYPHTWQQNEQIAHRAINQRRNRRLVVLTLKLFSVSVQDKYYYYHIHWCHQDITVEQVRPERKASHVLVRGQESWRTCQTSKSGVNGIKGSADNVEHHIQEADLGRHLEVWTSETVIPYQVCQWPLTITSEPLPLGTYRSPKYVTGQAH